MQVKPRPARRGRGVCDRSAEPGDQLLHRASCILGGWLVWRARWLYLGLGLWFGGFCGRHALCDRVEKSVFPPTCQFGCAIAMTPHQIIQPFGIGLGEILQHVLRDQFLAPGMTNAKPDPLIVFANVLMD